MFLRHIFMAGLATACGIAVSAGTFAFLLVIGVIPRMIKRCNFGERILMIENTVILGVLTGAVFSVMEWKAQPPYPGRRSPPCRIRGWRMSFWALMELQREFLWDVLRWHWQKY